MNKFLVVALFIASNLHGTAFMRPSLFSRASRATKVENLSNLRMLATDADTKVPDEGKFVKIIEIDGGFVVRVYVTQNGVIIEELWKLNEQKEYVKVRELAYVRK